MKSRRDFLKKSTIGATSIVFGVNNLKASGSENTLKNNSKTFGQTTITDPVINADQD